jgi:orotidine-5'-phosphate decarboxylase
MSGAGEADIGAAERVHVAPASGARAIVALDVPSLDEARALVERLDAACDFYKVGSELFSAEGPRVVEWLRSVKKEVFLDLKFHDIPNTVRSSTRVAARLGASLLTVHAAGGGAMLRAAVAGAEEGGGAGILAVTVLTSLGRWELGEAWGREIASVEEEADRLASLARACGVHGVVCAGTEAARIRTAHGDRLALLVPGIRLEGSPAGDQARIVTPAAAVRAGARYLVLGRTVTAAPDPVAAMSEVLRQMALSTDPT